MNPKGENSKKCGLEGIKESLAEPPEISPHLAWGAKSYSLGSKSWLQHQDSTLIPTLNPLAKANPKNLSI